MAITGLYGYRLDPSRKGKEEIEGLKELQKQLKQIGDEAKNDMKPAHKAAAEKVVVTAKPLAPIFTGRLHDSLRSSATQRAGRVLAGSKSVPYAGPIIFGWPIRGITANPFIFDALDQRRAEIVELYNKRMAEIIARHHLQPGPATPPIGAHMTPGTTL